MSFLTRIISSARIAFLPTVLVAWAKRRTRAGQWTTSDDLGVKH